MRVEMDEDIGFFAVFRTLVQDDHITNSVTDVYWFPNKQVRAGDLVILYSKSGTNTERVLKNGNTAHFFYWSKGVTLWKHANYAPTLVSTPEWSDLLSSG